MLNKIRLSLFGRDSFDFYVVKLVQRMSDSGLLSLLVKMVTLCTLKGH